MKKIATYVLTLFFYLNSIAQMDTAFIKKQKGFLFLSGYSLNYDRNEGEIKSFGFSDYFFASENFDKNCFLDSNKNISFKNGVRVEFFKSRYQLKGKAMKFKSTNDRCYIYDSFYVVPVNIDYKLFNDKWPLECRSEFFDIDVLKGSKIRFYHQRKAIIIKRITPILSGTKKRKKIKRKKQ
jgi:hypothetical protein